MATNNGTKAGDTVESKTTTDLSSQFDCAICYDLLYDPVVGTCGHDFCKHCYDRWISNKEVAPCPICKQPLPKNLSVCIRLRDAIVRMFPEQTAKKLQELKKEELEKNTRVSKRRRDSQTLHLQSTDHIVFNPEQSYTIHQIESNVPSLSRETNYGSRDLNSVITSYNSEARRNRIRVEPPPRHLHWVHIVNDPNASNSRSQRDTSADRPFQHLNTITPTIRSMTRYVATPALLWRSQLGRVNQRDQAISSEQAQAINELRQLHLGDTSTPRAFFTIGQRYSPPLRTRYSTRRRLRQVPTRFGPEFLLPPTTLPFSASDTLDTYFDS